MSPSTPRSVRTSLLVGATASATLVAALLSAPATGAAETGASASADRAVQSVLSGSESALVRVQFADAADRAAAERSGIEVAAEPTDRSSGLVDLVVTPSQLRGILKKGATVTQVIGTSSSGIREYQRSTRVAQAQAKTGLKAVKPARSSDTGSDSGSAAAAALEDTLVFLQSYWWTSGSQTFVQTEVATTATDDPDVEITITWTTADGQTGQFPLSRFSDSGEYQYHRANPVPVPAQPVSLTATSSLGGTATKAVTEWPSSTPPEAPSDYQQDFISAYMSPIDIKARINRLARQYPDLVDVIDLPNQSQGYRRTATAYVGDSATAALVVESVKFGSQGPNGWQVKAVAQGGINRPLAAQFGDRVLTIKLATGADGAPISTIDEVGAFVSAKFPTRFQAFAAVGTDGTATMPTSAPVRMADGLLGSSVPNQPWTVQALRIGHHRDGSKVGVLAYSQEHAREWATPLVTLEFAERLLANDATDDATSAMLENVDVFVVPVVNPDGANYSFNDANFQRKNMDNWCTGQQRDPRNRNSFGVDLNRNHTIGSVYDGYVGGSTNCLSSGAAGPSEASEPEARNLIDLAAAHPNIKFAMNVHSYGGYFMWPPGAYKAEGRITLPRPSIEESAEFQAAAKRIVGAIADHRGTVTWPGNTGPVADVLYSAGGNSADQLYYANGIYAWDFEVGNDIWNPATSQWEGVGFQPPYAEGHEEAMEYAGGLVEMVRVAADFQADGQ